MELGCNLRQNSMPKPASNRAFVSASRCRLGHVLSDDLPRGRPTVEALVRELVLGLRDYRHVDLPRLCEGLGLPQPPPSEGPVGSDSPALSKAKRMEAVFAQIDRGEYLFVLQRFVDRGLTPEKRNLAEELIWAAQTWPEIDTRTRRKVAQALDSVGQFWSDADGLVALIKRRWVDCDPSTIASWTGRGLVHEVVQHLVCNDDWTALEFFKQVGALDCTDRRVALFVQELLSGAVNPDEERLRRLAAATDAALASSGLRLLETNPVQGYPSFTIERSSSRVRPPRLILFASRVAKPDVRLADVLDTDIEVLTSTDKLLRYDRPIGTDGLR